MPTNSEIRDGNNLISNIIANEIGIGELNSINTISDMENIINNSSDSIYYTNDPIEGKLFICCGFNVNNKVVHSGNRTYADYSELDTVGLMEL